MKTVDKIEQLANECVASGETAVAGVLLCLAGTIHLGTTEDLHVLAHQFAEDQLLLIEANR